MMPFFLIIHGIILTMKSLENGVNELPKNAQNHLFLDLDGRNQRWIVVHMGIKVLTYLQISL
jgi:hypothetical protein